MGALGDGSRFDGRLLALIVGTIVVTAVVAVFTANLPIILVGIVVAEVVVAMMIKLGFRATSVIVGLFAVGLAGTASTVVPAAGILTLIGVVLLISNGIFSIGRVRVSRIVAVSAGLFVLSSTTAALSVVTLSSEFALRGWVSLVTPVFAAVAVAAAARGEDQVSGLRRRAVLGTIIIVVVLNVVFALRQAVFGLTPGEIAAAVAGESTYKVGSDIRLMGTFGTNQDFAVFTACLAPALLLLALKMEGKKKHWMLVLVALVYLSIFLSLTRTALIAGILAGILTLLIWERGSLTTRILRTAALITGAAAIAVLLVSQLNIPRVQSALLRFGTLFDLSDDKSFVARRGSTLPRSWEAFTTNPFGWGSGAAGPISQQFPSVAPLGPLVTDNGYLMIAIQLGLIGVAAFITLLTALVIKLGGRHSAGAYGPAAAAATLSLMIAMTTAQYWSLLGPMSLVAAVVGLGLAAANPRVASFAPRGLKLSAKTEVVT
jgi:hypothetical protein